MIQDKKLQLCDANAIDASGITTVGKCIDLGAAGKDGWGNALTESPGEGQTIYFNVGITTVLSAHALTVILAGAAAVGSSSALTSGVSLAAVYFAASAAAGQRRSIAVPSGGAYRYLKVHLTKGAGGATGSIEAWLSSSPSDTETAMK